MEINYLLFLCLLSLASSHILNKVLVDENPDALCLDGTKAAYYVKEGDKNRFLLNFEGGGWCGSPNGLNYTIEDCYQRSKGGLGSSNSYPSSFQQNEGILSSNAKNPFKNWTIIHFMYCDGTGHQGYRKAPIDYKGVKLYFRGHNTTIGTLESVDKRYHIFSEAFEIVISGQSAGGLAAFLWTNYIASRAPKTAKVWSLPDSGIFLDSTNFKTKTNTYRAVFQSFMSIANAQINPPTVECMVANPQEKWKCMFAQYIHKYIKVPLFPIQSLYDSWSLPNILGIGCEAVGSLANCNDAQKSYIDEYRLNTSAVLEQITENKINGCWAPSCSNHVYTRNEAMYSDNFAVPAQSTYNIAFSVAYWRQDPMGTHKHLDRDPWPSNKPCSGVKNNYLKYQELQ